MIRLTLSEMVGAMRGVVCGQTPTLSVSGVSTDSRTVGPDELFFAIRGQRFDGHDFVADALRRRAAGAVIETARAGCIAAALSGQADLPSPPVLIQVDHTVAALGRLAGFHRRQLSLDVIAVVGSNGKTTTKAMIDHILSLRRKGRSSPRSFNNAIGVPLTLLSAEAADDYLVVEIGTNAPGEIVALAELTRPNMAVITCIAEEHLEGLGDLAGVATEECSLLEGLPPGGFAAVNIDSPLARDRLPPAGVTRVTFGAHADADLRVTQAQHESPWLHFTLNGRFEYRLRGAGTHNAWNAAGAIAVARRLGFEHAEIAARLESFVFPPMRTELVQLGGVTLINDAYNANPVSALAAIRTLEAQPARGRRIAVLGEMRELGGQSQELHRQVAQRLRDGQVDHVMLVGEAARTLYDGLSDDARSGPSVECCADVAACAARLPKIVQDGDVVLLKASRAVGLERVVEPLRQGLAATPVA